MHPSEMRGDAWDRFARSRLDLFDRRQTKPRFSCDAFYVSLTPSDPRTLVSFTAYWFALFSHRRDAIWKGLVEVPLDGLDDDQAAWNVLESKNEP
jgi:hypothetical protein